VRQFYRVLAVGCSALCAPTLRECCEPLWTMRRRVGSRCTTGQRIAAAEQPVSDGADLVLGADGSDLATKQRLYKVALAEYERRWRPLVEE
jgi:hypothetical protein